MKSDISKSVFWGVVSHDECKHLSYLLEVLINALLLDWFQPCGQNTGIDVLRKKLEYRGGVVNTFDVRGDIYPAVEVSPLPSRGGILLVEGGQYKRSLGAYLVVKHDSQLPTALIQQLDQPPK